MKSLKFFIIFLQLFAFKTLYAFPLVVNHSQFHSRVVLKNAGSEELDSSIASQLKILVCSSTSCTAKRRKIGLDELATFVGLYERKEGACASDVEVTEASCLGRCGKAPCVGIEHEDYVGTVALEGMNPNEFQDSL